MSLSAWRYFELEFFDRFAPFARAGSAHFFFLDEKEAKNQGFREILCFLRFAPLDGVNSHCVLKQTSSIRFAQLEKLPNFSRCHC